MTRTKTTFPAPKKYTQETSRVHSVRLDDDDEKQVEIIQAELQQPGLKIDFADAVRRSLHFHAEQLLLKKKGRRKDDIESSNGNGSSA